MTDELKEMRVSNEAMHDAEELRRRIADEGYLLFKGLQSRDKILELRREMMAVIQQVGWLRAGTDPMDGIADLGTRCTEGDNEYSAGYAQVYRIESFHRSAHWPEYVDMVEQILGAAAMPHPQKIARIWFPRYTEHTTPKHQDFVHFQGSFDNLTCWAPIGDCPVELGGLAVIPGSHKVNRVLEHHFSLGAGGLRIDEKDQEEVDPVWYSTDYEAGDTLFFPALTIHRALPNHSGDRLRLSLDNRYQAVGAPIAEHMLEPHGPSQLTWNDIYPHWQSEDLKYYWKSYDNPVVGRDFSFGRKGWAEALDLARGGDEDAIFMLQRAIRNSREGVDLEEAAAVLKGIGVEPG